MSAAAMRPSFSQAYNALRGLSWQEYDTKLEELYAVFDEDEMSKFWTFAEEQAEKREAATWAKLPQRSTIEEFRRALLSLDCTNSKALQEFWSSIQRCALGPATDPILLGTAYDISKRWHLWLQTDTPCLSYFDDSGKNDHLNDTAFDGTFSSNVNHANIVALKPHSSSLETSKHVLEYGLCLGTVLYRASTDNNTKDFHRTPILVYMNVIDKSLWMVLGSYYMDEVGNQLSTRSSTLSDFLPNKMAELKACGCLCFATTINLGHATKSDDVLASARTFGPLLLPSTADLTQVKDTLVTSRNRDCNVSSKSAYATLGR